MNQNLKITIIGLGYVGLPLAVEFAKKYNVVGFDVNNARINDLERGEDTTLEVDKSDLLSVLDNTNETCGFFPTSDKSFIKDSNVYIVTVPTPVDDDNNPVITPLINASETVGSFLKSGDVVIYESTVYPGCTEDDCVPVLEKFSGLRFNKDFFCGYSPERINPGDKTHTVTKIKKVTSGSTNEIATFVDNLYSSIITAGTHKASSIKVAEAAKVIENAQRDINIAFINELAKIFNLLDIDTHEVLSAAGSKWNFLPFKPGIVGGHCIGVDPFYLANKARSLGYYPEIILAGRKMNDSMGEYIALEIIKLMNYKSIKISKSNILMLGITFKENCPDIRNTKAIDIYKKLKSYDASIDVYDPWACPIEVKNQFDLELIKNFNNNRYDVIILVVAHKEFLEINYNLIKNSKSVIYDVKGILNKEIIDNRL